MHIIVSKHDVCNTAISTTQTTRGLNNMLKINTTETKSGSLKGLNLMLHMFMWQNYLCNAWN